MTHAHPQVIREKLANLRPTQVTVGAIEVSNKRETWKVLKSKHREAFLEQHWFPSVIGPKNRYYIVDHHHLGNALIHEDIKSVFLLPVKDLSWLDIDTFWRVMEFHHWVHPYDETGKRVNFDDIPKKLSQLKDDPYRSLAGILRRDGGFAKDITPFSEFLWADFFRARISSDLMQNNWEQAIKEAMTLAHSQAGRYLPGWSPGVCD